MKVKEFFNELSKMVDICNYTINCNDCPYNHNGVKVCEMIGPLKPFQILPDLTEFQARALSAVKDDELREDAEE